MCQKEAWPQFVLLVIGAARGSSRRSSKKCWLGSGTILARPGGCCHKCGIEYIFPLQAHIQKEVATTLTSTPTSISKLSIGAQQQHSRGETGPIEQGRRLVMIIFCPPNHSTRNQL